jgi:DNA polymerase-3 subunit delta'
VEQIRALPGFINVSSHRGGPKIVLIHPAEALNVNAANALLKSLEEPPPRTYFLLVTHRPQQLPPTIKSRCRHVALAAPDAKTAAGWLATQGVREPDLALAHAGYAPLLALEIDTPEYWGARAAFMRHLTARDLDVLSAAESASDLPLPNVLAWLQKWSYDLARYHALRAVRYNPDYADAAGHTALQADRLRTVRFHRDMVKLQRVVHHPLNAKLFIEDVLFAYRDLFQPAAPTRS